MIGGVRFILYGVRLRHQDTSLQRQSPYNEGSLGETEVIVFFLR